MSDGAEVCVKNVPDEDTIYTKTANGVNQKQQSCWSISVSPAKN